MSVFWVRRRAQEPQWARHLPAHLLAAALCILILAVTVAQKFLEGGWLTLLITSVLIAFCFAVKRHYNLVARAVGRLDAELPGPDEAPEMYPFPQDAEPARKLDPGKPVAVLFVGGYSGLGRHALLTLMRKFPGYFSGVVFVTVAVVDSDVFKGATELPALEERTRNSLKDYERFAATLGLPARSEYSVGTEVAVEAEQLALGLVHWYPNVVFVAGQIVFDEDTGWNRLLHNETAFLIQQRLQHNGVPMIVLPVQLSLRTSRDYLPPGSVRGKRILEELRERSG
jgi:hypothetical protein